MRTPRKPAPLIGRAIIETEEGAVIGADALGEVLDEREELAVDAAGMGESRELVEVVADPVELVDDAEIGGGGYGRQLAVKERLPHVDRERQAGLCGELEDGGMVAGGETDDQPRVEPVVDRDGRPAGPARRTRGGAHAKRMIAVAR